MAENLMLTEAYEIVVPVSIDLNREAGAYKYTARDENKFNGRYIVGGVSNKIEAEMIKILGSDAVKSVAIKESRDEDGKVSPAARIVLNGSAKPLNVSSLLNGGVCKKYGISSVTFCLPDENKTRGIRCRVAKDGVRVYEVANGSYKIDINWYAEEKRCSVLVFVSDDGSVKLLERRGVTEEQLHAYKEVKVGKQLQAKFLYEALMSK